MSRKKTEGKVLSALKDEIEVLVLEEGLSDAEIAARLDQPINKIYRIRTAELKILYWTKKKSCSRCGESKSLTVFKDEGDICIKCRRIIGLQKPYKQLNPRKVKSSKISTIEIECMRCHEEFDSEVWEANGMLQHYYNCPHCREIITGMDRVGI